MRWRNTETPTFAGAGGTKPAIVETLDLVDHDGAVQATITKGVDGTLSSDLPGDFTPASSAEVNTGTDNTKPVTALALAGSGYGPAGVKRYVALLSQTGTEAPVATVVENTTSDTLGLTRSGAGEYVIDSPLSVFTAKTLCFASNGLPSNLATKGVTLLCYMAGAGAVYLKAVDIAGNFVDVDLTAGSISLQILIYPA